MDGFDYTVRVGWANKIVPDAENQSIPFPNVFASNTWLYVKQGSELGLSAAIASNGFNASIAFSQWNPENDKKIVFAAGAAGTTDTAFLKATGYELHAGYTADMGLGGDTNIDVGYYNTKNANQPMLTKLAVGTAAGVVKWDKAESKAAAFSIGVTQSYGKGKLFAKMVSVNEGEFTYNANTVNTQVHGTNSPADDVTKAEYASFTGFILGMSYDF